MSKNSYFLAGQWNVSCDRCGLKIKSSVARKTWDGFYVCPEHWEPRQPLDFLRGIKDTQSVPYSRPGATNTTILIVTSAYTLLSTDYSIYADATNAPFTVYLPASPALMEIHYVEKIDISSNVITVNGNGNLIMGYTTDTLKTQYTGKIYQFTGVQWNILSTYPSES